MRIRKAFTIVELLVVIGIILVIMSLMIPSVSKAIEKSNIAAAKAMLEKIEMAIRNYQSAYNQWPPDLSYKYLGLKLPSYNFGAVLPLLQYEKDKVADPSAAQGNWVYKDPWDQEFMYFWFGQDTYLGAVNKFKTAYTALVASGSFLNPTSGVNRLTDVQVTEGVTTKLVPGFLLWSLGPDITNATPDDIGNWGKTRNKMVSGI